MNGRQFGAMLGADGHCGWRLWAPLAEHAELVLFDDDGSPSASHRMEKQDHGFYSFERGQISVGQRYAFGMDGKSPLPDPASQWQPDGVHRPSAVWRANAFEWSQKQRRGISLQDLVIYELHVGTFTSEGTFAAIIPRLAQLRDLGITAIELMPVGQFPGHRGWGYDGVYWFAVQESYGGPTGLQRLVDACHSLGLAVILDVIYNHLGPEGNYLGQFGPFYTDRHQTPWGAAINYDGPSCRTVRDFVLENVRQWIRDFHVDGLRLDAVHAIHDDSPTNILAEIKVAAMDEAKKTGAEVHVIAESNLNDVRLIDSSSIGGYGLDAQWSDDFHHCVHTLLTGERDGYYSDFNAPATQLVKALTDVFVFDGCFSPFLSRNHGAPIGQHSGERFVVSVQTHDQVGNRAIGDRFGTLLEPAQQRLAAGLLLLAPNIPLLFMGEEYGETRPFPFFCDFGDEALREAVRRGRREEFASFSWSGELPDPTTRSTFESATLSWDWSAGSAQAGLRTLYRELLLLRRTHPALRDFKHRWARLLPNSINADVLHLRRGDPQNPRQCLYAVFNLGARPVPIPSIAEMPTEILLQSEESRFGGGADGIMVHGEMRPFALAVFGYLKEVTCDERNS